MITAEKNYNNPTCCGQTAEHYRIYYPPHSYEEGFKCNKCGRIRIPFITNWDSSYMDAMEEIRLKGIAEDEAMEKSRGDHNRLLAKIIIQIVSAELKDPIQRDWYTTISDAQDLQQFVHTAIEKKYPWAYIKDTVVKHIDMNLRFNPPITFQELQQQFPCEIISDGNILENICIRVIESQPDAVSDFKKGKTAALNRLKGMVMKESNGKADIKLAEQILIKKMAQ